MSSSSTAALAPIVALQPTDTLSFELSRDTAPKAVLSITNTSGGRVAFKVKTTQPTWFYVRPNQHVLDIGQTEDVSIVLVEGECNKFVEMGEASHRAIASLRFLVQSRPVDEATYGTIMTAPANVRASEFSRIWDDSSKDDRRNQKLRVEFSFAEATKALPSVPEDAELSSPVSSRIDGLRASATAATNPDLSGSKSMPDPSSMSPEALLAELQSLRKKYDAVVEYTVHLTAERDYHFTQAEERRKEESRDKSKRKSDAAAPRHSKGGNDKALDKKNGGFSGFSPLVLVLIALLAFFLGRWIKF